MRAIIANAGNANAFTGKAGDRAVDESTRAVAQTIGCSRNEVFMASTGVIGQPMTTDKIVAGVPKLVERAARRWLDGRGQGDHDHRHVPQSGDAAGQDRRQHRHHQRLRQGLGHDRARHGDHAGLRLHRRQDPAARAADILRAATDKSFNCITVDSDTSTSDTFLLAATGTARHAKISESDDPNLADFRRALEALMIDLAQQIVRDGEGASKFVTVTVTGATSVAAARKIGLSIANSPLVKTAIAGEDANWGRIVMAIGKSGEKADRDKLGISMGGVKITDKGQLVPGYDETPVANHMKGQYIDIAVDLGLGRGKSTVWTCDLTHRLHRHQRQLPELILWPVRPRTIRSTPVPARRPMRASGALYWSPLWR